MTRTDIDVMTKVMADVVRLHVDRAMSPLVERITTLEGRPIPDSGKDGIDGRDGKDAEPIKREQIVEAVLSCPDVIRESVVTYFTENPPKDGEHGADGKSITIDDVTPIIKSEVFNFISSIPTPKPGKDGKDGTNGKDGAHLAGAIIDRDDRLVLTLSDGTTKELGPVVGRDGKDGERGIPGRDGFSPDDFEFEQKDDGRTIVARFKRGDDVVAREFKFNCILDRGVWKEAKYVPGDGVTWGGSFWIAQCETDTKPETSADWRLAVKRGQNGKDGKPGDIGPQGLHGKDWEGNRR